jgi:hypothetical protein
VGPLAEWWASSWRPPQQLDGIDLQFRPCLHLARSLADSRIDNSPRMRDKVVLEREQNLAIT